jgi:hypothetical protein
MSSRNAIVFVVAVALVGCGIGQKGATTGRARLPVRHGIFATSPTDPIHQLSLTVDLAPDLRVPAGITPIQVTVRDPSRSLVNDAIVYVGLDSKLGMTPKMVVVASNREDGRYTAELPLVYDSEWRFTVRAYSSGRSGVLTVVEDTN